MFFTAIFPYLLRADKVTGGGKSRSQHLSEHVLVVGLLRRNKQNIHLASKNIEIRPNNALNLICFASKNIEIRPNNPLNFIYFAIKNLKIRPTKQSKLETKQSHGSVKFTRNFCKASILI